MGSNDGKIYALDAGSGACLWTAVTGSKVGSSRTIAGGTVYVGSKAVGYMRIAFIDLPSVPRPNRAQGVPNDNLKS
jgi:outer membrane protein assembly factor BamB